jgi:hypothetical protein
MDASNSRASNIRNTCIRRNTCNSMGATSTKDASNSKANNRNIINSTSKSMDKERAWMPVTVGPAAEETPATKEATAIAWMPAASWTRA